MNPKNISAKVNEEIFLGINNVIIPKLIENTPFKTGETSANWEVLKGNNLGEFIIRNKKGDIVHYLEKGTESHIITPNKKKMLRFEFKDKDGNSKQPKFRNAKDNLIFQEKGEIFFYNKAGFPVFGFKKEGNKIFMFAKKVKHPGIKARFFVRETLNDKELWKKIGITMSKNLK